MTIPCPANETERIQALRQYNVMDSEQEEVYDSIVRLAAHVCQTPFAFVSLVDEDRVWTKAAFGFPRTEVPRNEDFCAYTILESDFLEFSDTGLDERTSRFPLVQGGPGFRFYAGAVLRTMDGLPLGAVCVLDTHPRSLNEEQRTCLRVMAREVMANFELRKKNAELASALQVARRLNAQKGEMLAFISHEIRNPMSSIAMILELILDESMDQEMKQSLLNIQACTKTVVALLNDLLDLFKMEAGKLQLIKAPFSLDALLETVESTAQAQAGLKRIKFQDLRRGRIPSMVQGDALRLGQILSNLLGNAIKFTPPGGVIKLEVEAMPSPRGETWLKFAVEDSGVGLPDGASLFNPYEQGDTYRAKTFGGTGLGLAVCKQLVELMGGEIQATNLETGGSRFSFSVHLEEVAESASVEGEI